ncbi:MAG TPA: zinc ribbon domain-containing protein [candidate division Zixibacteria bacterium]|nr:zinc ribbon domain-containing protein [candidate division Zixibacteria bacterium]
MPTYLYHCLDCKYEFEEFQSITDPVIDKCPKCGGRAERIITGGVGFLFKGSGFYITDHRSASYNKAKAADTSGSAGSSPPPPPKSSNNK